MAKKEVASLIWPFSLLLFLSSVYSSFFAHSLHSIDYNYIYMYMIYVPSIHPLPFHPLPFLLLPFLPLFIRSFYLLFIHSLTQFNATSHLLLSSEKHNIMCASFSLLLFLLSSFFFFLSTSFPSYLPPLILSLTHSLTHSHHLLLLHYSSFINSTDHCSTVVRHLQIFFSSLSFGLPFLPPSLLFPLTLIPAFPLPVGPFILLSFPFDRSVSQSYSQSGYIAKHQQQQPQGHPPLLSHSLSHSPLSSFILNIYSDVLRPHFLFSSRDNPRSAKHSQKPYTRTPLWTCYG
ncbi:MAG: hypothetical protein J3R72DRAFT_121373 [Linnemannia gamsii]|nr:MAG: hypothetical protein J3R72DRAFT_121373 [Linnemannia gamsii]